MTFDELVKAARESDGARRNGLYFEMTARMERTLIELARQELAPWSREEILQVIEVAECCFADLSEWEQSFIRSVARHVRLRINYEDGFDLLTEKQLLVLRRIERKLGQRAEAAIAKMNI